MTQEEAPAPVPTWVAVIITLAMILTTTYVVLAVHQRQMESIEDITKIFESCDRCMINESPIIDCTHNSANAGESFCKEIRDTKCRANCTINLV